MTPFPPELDRFDQRALEQSGDVHCFVDRSLSIRWVNPAWLQFAAANGGEPAISRSWSVGARLLDAIQGPLRDWYGERIARCAAEQQVWQHDYECSSPDELRLFHLTAYPVPSGGVLFVHSLVRSAPRAGAAPPLPAAYRDVAGNVTQCGHCRRFRRPTGPERWDWIPEWVARVPPETSHGLCPTCLDHFYPA